MRQRTKEGWLARKQLKRRTIFKHKDRARKILYYAVKKGKLTRRVTCEDCGDFGTEGHHEDYTRPLEVRWLCRTCHIEVHRKDNAESRQSRQQPEDNRQRA